MILRPHEWLIMKRYLLPRGGERVIVLVAAISLGAVTLGVAALVIITSVTNGSRELLFGQIIQSTPHAVVRGKGGSLKGWRQVVAEARRVPGVTEAAPLIEQRLMVASRGYVLPAQLKGMTAQAIAAPAMRRILVAGGLDVKAGERRVVIGAKLADFLRVVPGGSVDLVTVEGKAADLSVRTVAYDVAGVIEAEIEEVDSSVLMPIEDAQALVGLDDAVTSVAIRTADPHRADLLLAPLARRLAPVGELKSWRALNATLSEALAVDAAGMMVVLTLIILVAAFNILSALVMLVRAKTGDIAILRTMGASRRSILRLFIALGTAIGALGTVAGVMLGLLFLYFRAGIGNAIQRATGPTSETASAFLAELPALVEPAEVGAIIFFALLLSFLATLYPAYKAARTDPVRVLKGA